MHYSEINATGAIRLAYRLWREGMKNNRLLKTGIIGSVIVALFCVTPVMVLLFGVLGLTALVGWLDFVLFPTLAAFLLITGYALWKRRCAQ
jgi:mercuric ion transport protein